jgi:hypothetical protein
MAVSNRPGEVKTSLLFCPVPVVLPKELPSFCYFNQVLGAITDSMLRRGVIAARKKGLTILKC